MLLGMRPSRALAALAAHRLSCSSLAWNARPLHHLAPNSNLFRHANIPSFHTSSRSPPSDDPTHARGFLSCADGDEDSGLSKQHQETRILGYSPEQLYAVVAAVDLYEDFVPWCRKSTVVRRKDDEALDAELEIGFQFFVERYMSHVELKRPTLIKTTASQSKLFDYLVNIWEFKAGPVPGTCDLHFCVDFQFRSPLYRRVANMFFEEVVSRLVGSFENRCNTVYGPGTKVLEGAYGS